MVQSKTDHEIFDTKDENDRSGTQTFLVDYGLTWKLAKFALDRER